MATLPILFHNLKNYDMHALCLLGFSKMKNWTLKPIAQTKEKYITLVATAVVGYDEEEKPIYFTLRFIDSYQFMNTSLERLVNSMDKSRMQHVHQCNQFITLSDDILFGKGVFPYSYLDGKDKLKETKLPPKSAFFDTLTNSLRITDEEYDRAQRAWDQFQCQTFN